MPIAQGTGFISMADYINGNQDARNADIAGINAGETAALDTTQGNIESEIGTVAKNTPAAINDELSAKSGQPNDAQYKQWEQDQAKGGYNTPGGTGDPTQNPYNTSGKDDANTRAYLAGAPGDQYGGQKLEGDIASAGAVQGAHAANLANWGGVFDAEAQEHKGQGGYGDAGAAFDATIAGTGGFQDVAKRGAGLEDKLSGDYNAAIHNAGQTPYDTSGASYTPTGYRTSGGQEYTQNPDNPQDRGGAPSKTQMRPFGPTYSSDPNAPNYQTGQTTAGNPIYGNPPPTPIELNPTGGNAPTRDQNGRITTYGQAPPGGGFNVSLPDQRNEERTAQKTKNLPVTEEPYPNPFNWAG